MYANPFVIGGNERWEVSVLTCAHNRDNDDEKLRLGEQALIDLDIAQVHQTRFLGHPSLKKLVNLRNHLPTSITRIEP